MLLFSYSALSFDVNICCLYYHNFFCVSIQCRQEIFEVFGDDIPDYDKLGSLEFTTACIKEVCLVECITIFIWQCYLLNIILSQLFYTTSRSDYFPQFSVLVVFWTSPLSLNAVLYFSQAHLVRCSTVRKSVVVDVGSG